MTAFPDILAGRICHSAVDASHLNFDGTMPMCLGTTCSVYHACLLSEIQAMIELERLKKCGTGRAVLERLSREAKP